MKVVVLFNRHKGQDNIAVFETKEKARNAVIDIVDRRCKGSLPQWHSDTIAHSAHAGSFELIEQRVR